MPDLLTHVLVGYSIGTLLSLRDERIRSAQVSLVMAGALSPDLAKVRLFLPADIVQAVVGVPFSWAPLHTLGGTLLVVPLGALLVAPEYRRQAVALIALGAASHHALDVALLTATGESYAVFFPISQYRLPSLDLYLSTDRWPAIVSGALAAVLWAVRRSSTAAQSTRS
ncbi:metal-dependent hydrolase [Natrinema sp. 1APR25-10V2]|uniref:metal-dependent hydrolase n=1 Tax=Natrinema sp. 1APR25-10V2 TaxID=2951081 RepID=UPI002874862B|nr:metal-dependent hydrolase [Natrinema sp. 1APR25-10V2]MDS0474396.1 metal-dependent hydrolase [Natrinema sp. 1APR25-10V2]